jgi:hypothetical protein
VVFLIGDEELRLGIRGEEKQGKSKDGGFHGQSIGQAVNLLRKKWSAKKQSRLHQWFARAETH